MLNKIFISKSQKVSAHILGRKILNRAVKILLSTENVQIAFNENGKPYLKDYPDFYFNISHCEDTVAVAFGGSELGVDIEKLRTVNPRVADRFFTQREREQIKVSDDFFKIWTKKEALIKRYGKSLKDISSIDTTYRNDIKTFLESDLVISLCCENSKDFQLEYILEKEL